MAQDEAHYPIRHQKEATPMSKYTIHVDTQAPRQASPSPYQSFALDSLEQLTPEVISDLRRIRHQVGIYVYVTGGRKVGTITKDGLQLALVEENDNA